MDVEASRQARGACCIGLCHTQLMPLLLLRLIEKGGKGWVRRREGKLKALAPRFCARGYKAACEKLVSRVGAAPHGRLWLPQYSIDTYICPRRLQGCPLGHCQQCKVLEHCAYFSLKIGCHLHMV